MNRGMCSLTRNDQCQIENELSTSTQAMADSMTPQEKRAINIEIIKILHRNNLTYRQAKNVLLDALESIKDSRLSR